MMVLMMDLKESLASMRRRLMICTRSALESFSVFELMNLMSLLEIFRYLCLTSEFSSSNMGSR